MLPNGHLWILGGKLQNGERTDSIISFDPWQKKWSMVSEVKLTRPLSGFQAIVFNSK
jgi:hypothetical protein